MDLPEHSAFAFVSSDDDGEGPAACRTLGSGGHTLGSGGSSTPAPSCGTRQTAPEQQQGRSKRKAALAAAAQQAAQGDAAKGRPKNLTAAELEAMLAQKQLEYEALRRENETLRAKALMLENGRDSSCSLQVLAALCCKCSCRAAAHR
jgi:hypothetical protein